MSKREDLYDFENFFYRIPLCAQIKDERMQDQLKEFLLYYNDSKDVFGSKEGRYTWYMDHGLVHARNIWCIANRLYSINSYLKNATDEEIFIFCHSIWLHDIGMSTALTPIRNYEQELILFLNQFSNTPLKSIEYDNSPLIRDHHSLISRFFIENNQTCQSLKIVGTYPENIRKKIGLICHYHQSSHIINNAQILETNKMYFKKKNLSEEITQNNYDQNIIFLATLLRFIDECDNTNKRLVNEIQEKTTKNSTEESITKLWKNIEVQLPSPTLKNSWRECKYSSSDDIEKINENLIQFRQEIKNNDNIFLNGLLTEFSSNLKAITEYESKKVFDDLYFTPNRIILPRSSINLENRKHYENLMTEKLYRELESCTLILKELNKKIVELEYLNEESIIVLDSMTQEEYEANLLNPESLFIKYIFTNKKGCNNYNDYLTLIAEFKHKKIFDETPSIQDIFQKIINDNIFFKELIDKPDLLDKIIPIYNGANGNANLYFKELLKKCAKQKSKFTIERWISLNPLIIEKNSYEIGKIEKFEQKLQSLSTGISFNLRENYLDYHEEVNKIKALWRQKNWKETLTACKNLETTHPYGNFQWKLYDTMGRCYFELKEYDNAIKYFNKSIELRDEKNDSYNYLGRIYHKQKKYTTAIEFYEKWLKKNNKANHESLLILGDCYYHERKYDEQIKILKKALDLYPYCTNCIRDLSRAYGKKHEFENAHTLLDRIISTLKSEENDPKIDLVLSGCYDNKGHILNEQKRFREAILCLKDAIKINKNYLSPWKNYVYSCLFTDIIENREKFILTPEVFQEALVYITESDQRNALLSSEVLLSFFKKAIYYGYIDSFEQVEKIKLEFNNVFDSVFKKYKINPVYISIPMIKQSCCEGSRAKENMTNVQKIFPDVDISAIIIQTREVNN